jgi:hypothetical protein
METVTLPETETAPAENTNAYEDSVKILTEAFSFFNKELENGRLAMPVINILPRGKKNALGWFWSGKWNLDGKPTSEISISAETLSRPPEEVLETVIHEMAHYANDVDQKKDCRQNYHNKVFKSKAESYGLVVTKSPRYGWGHTTLGEKAKALVDRFIQQTNFTGFKLARGARVSGLLYTKAYYVAVEDESTKNKIQELAKAQGLSTKDFVAEMLQLYVHHNGE